MRLTNGHAAAQKGTSGFQDRAARLRSGRTAAPLLREVFPSATHLTVRLQFLAQEGPAHADQCFVLYSGARAYFGFSCPYGDCDGIYDLSQAAQSALQHPTARASGTLECGGARSRHRIPRQHCGLQVSYVMTAEHHQQAAPQRRLESISSEAP